MIVSAWNLTFFNRFLEIWTHLKGRKKMFDFHQRISVREICITFGLRIFSSELNYGTNLICFFFASQFFLWREKVSDDFLLIELKKSCRWVSVIFTTTVNERWKICWFCSICKELFCRECRRQRSELSFLCTDRRCTELEAKSWNKEKIVDFPSRKKWKRTFPTFESPIIKNLRSKSLFMSNVDSSAFEMLFRWKCVIILHLMVEFYSSLNVGDRRKKKESTTRFFRFFSVRFRAERKKVTVSKCWFSFLFFKLIEKSTGKNVEFAERVDFSLGPKTLFVQSLFDA